VYSSNKSLEACQLYEPTLGVEYSYALVLQPNGASYFIRAGGNWLLLTATYSNANTPLYVAVDNIDATFIISSIRVPVPIWRWNLLALDSFSRIAITLGVTDGIFGLNHEGGGNRAWTAQIGTWGTNGSSAACAVLVGGIGIATVFLTTPDIHVGCNVAWVGGVVGIVVRYTDVNNYAYVYIDGTNISAHQVVAGVDSEVVAPVAITYNPINTLIAHLQGTTIEIGYGTNVLGVGTLHSSLISPQCGMYSTNIANELGMFIVSARGTGGEYNELDKFMQ
jgi:hypothetical protein